jgi:hypothetical protein
LQQALHYCTIARDALPQDTGLQMMFLRLSLAAGKTDAAREVLEHLASEGASPTLWRPYAAELEWIERRFGRITGVLQPLGTRQVAPRLRPVVRVWQTETPTRSEPVISDAPAVQRPGIAPRPADPAPAPTPLSDADRLLLG